MEWTDDGGTGVWRRKKPEQEQPPIPNLPEPTTTAAVPPPAEEPQPEPTLPTEAATAAAPPQTQPTDVSSFSQARPSQFQFLATLEGIMSKLEMNHELIVEGFKLFRHRLKMQHLRLEKMDAQIEGIKLHLGFDNANVATIMRQYQREQQEAEEARKKQ